MGGWCVWYLIQKLSILLSVQRLLPFVSNLSVCIQAHRDGWVAAMIGGADCLEHDTVKFVGLGCFGGLNLASLVTCSYTEHPTFRVNKATVTNFPIYSPILPQLRPFGNSLFNGCTFFHATSSLYHFHKLYCKSNENSLFH